MLVSVISEPSLYVNLLLSIFISLYLKYFLAFLSNICTPRFTTDKTGPKKEIKNPPDCTVVQVGDFENYILPNEQFTIYKNLAKLQKCKQEFGKNKCGKIASSLELPVTFDERYFGIIFFPFIDFDFLLSYNKTKNASLPQNSAQLNNVNIGLVTELLLYINIYSS